VKRRGGRNSEWERRREWPRGFEQGNSRLQARREAWNRQRSRGANGSQLTALGSDVGCREGSCGRLAVLGHPALLEGRALGQPEASHRPEHGLELKQQQEGAENDLHEQNTIPHRLGDQGTMALAVD